MDGSSLGGGRGNQLTFNCDVLKLYKCFDICPTFSLLKMTGKHQPITGLIGLPFQFLFAAPNILLKHETDLTVADSTFQTSKSKSLGSLSILYCSGTCPKLVSPHSYGTLNVPVKTAFSPSRGRKSIPQNPADLAVM